MKGKSARRVLIIGIAILLSISAFGTSTLAWFSMNTRVTVNQVTLNTTAPSNMLIKSDINDSWSSYSTATTDVVGGFAPSSSADGVTFYGLEGKHYLGTEGEGAIIENDYDTNIHLRQVNHVDETGVFYAEFPLYIKASEGNHLTQDFNVYLKQFNVTTSSEDHIEKTIRMSVTQVTPYGGAAVTGGVVIKDDGTVEDVNEHVLVESSAVMYKYDKNTAVKPIESLSTDPETLNTAILGTDSANTDNDESVTCFSVDYTGENYTTIIVRIWIEGQHPDCLTKIDKDVVSVSLIWAIIE